MNRSKKIFRRAKKVIPGGVNSPVRAWKSVGADPLVIRRGKGSLIFDADGKRYVDLVGSWGPLILGHAHPTIVRAVHR
jgi:glutamate-1-semialdehyde 2,1-aminomutase